MKLIDSAAKYIKNLRNPYWVSKCTYIRYWETLEIDDKAVLLESQSAIKADGNIYYILKYLTSAPEYRGYRIYLSSWGRYKSSIKALLKKGGIKGVEIVIYASDRYVRLLSSAKYLVTDATFPFYFMKKKGQVYLNTWHGTPLKTLGKAIHDFSSIGNVQRNFVSADYLLYPNEFTKKVLIRDYMLENISSGSAVLSGYPRNSVFFDEEARERVRSELNPSGKRIYAYMPTWRGKADKYGSARANAYLYYYLSELDKALEDDEEMFVNLHPLLTDKKDGIDFSGFSHIRQFPKGYETYEVLNIADVLITDYSSVFFDFANTKKKIVLFPYDKDEYLSERGLYFSMDELPFPQVYDLESLIGELRSGKNYDEKDFLGKFCPYDSIDAAKNICDYVILGKDTGLKSEKIPDNGKENVLLYAGNLDRNGITASLRSLTDALDRKGRNYFLTFCQGRVKHATEQLGTFADDLNYFAIAEARNLTIWDRIVKKLFSRKLIGAGLYMRFSGKRMKEDFERAYGNARFEAAIQFSGYSDDWILTYSTFPGKNAIFVHNDMISEIRTRKIQRRSVLRYAYRNYDHVVTVSEDIIAPTLRISGKKDNVITVHNIIDYRSILERSLEPVTLDRDTRCSVSEEKLREILSSESRVFINVGRFSPEKGHERLVRAFSRLVKDNPDVYLIIMGGNSRDKGYEKLEAEVREMALEKNVILLLSLSNPYPVIRSCDYFIMSSFYEGLPMVLFEADVLGLPIASTDVDGPHGFLSRYGGTLVENSEDGILRGMEMLLGGSVGTLSIDYDEYNRECLSEFERIFS